MKNRLISALRWSERYTKTDMVYLSSGAFWGNLNAAVVAIMAFIGSVLFAKYLSKDAYGTYQYILSIASLIGATTLTGMNAAVTRAVALGHEGELKRSVRYQLVMSFIPMTLGLVIALWYFIQGNHELSAAFAWISIFLPLGNAFNTWAAYTGGKKLFRVGTYYGLANNIMSYGGVLLALFFFRDYLWVAFANFFFLFLSNYIIYKLVVRNIPPNAVVDDETRSYGTHLSVMGVIGVLASQLDSLLIFHFVGSAALAVYSLATVIPERIAGMLKFLPAIILPKLSSRSEDYVRVFLRKKLWIALGFSVLIIISYAAMAPWIFQTFFPAYSESIIFTQVYSLSFFSLTAVIIQMALTSQRKTKELYILNTFMPIFRIVLMAVLMYFYGIWGLLWAQIANNLVSIVLQILLLKLRLS